MRAGLIMGTFCGVPHNLGVMVHRMSICQGVCGPRDRDIVAIGPATEGALLGPCV